MSDRVSLGRIAMRNALQLRRGLSIPRESPLNVFDVAASIGVDVQFVDSPTLEGMFYRGPHPQIFLPSRQHRPKGRIAFSCAHELGHFQLGHGTQVDEYVEGSQETGAKPDEELAADTFAASLLMPRQAVVQRFELRSWELSDATPPQLFAVAAELDVGYSTLLKHVRYGLKLVNDAWMTTRLKVAPKEIRQELTGEADPPRIVIVDRYWSNIPIDLEIGDEVAIPLNLRVVSGNLIREAGSHGEHARWIAIRSGETCIQINDRKHHVRVARSGYCGLLKYRYLNDPDEA